MPAPSRRKEDSTSRKRRDEKYILVEAERHPHRLWPPIRKDTDELSKLVDSKNFVRVLTQVGLNQYIAIQYYIYCDDDLWACGDAIVLNQNPDKKIMCQCLCVKTRKQCCAYDETSHEFIMVCPNCFIPAIGIKNTHWKCSHCELQIKYDNINDASFAKVPCEMCPVEIGWEKVEEMKDFFKERLQVRSHLVAGNIEKMMKDMEE